MSGYKSAQYVVGIEFPHEYMIGCDVHFPPQRHGILQGVVADVDDPRIPGYCSCTSKHAHTCCSQDTHTEKHTPMQWHACVKRNPRESQPHTRSGLPAAACLCVTLGHAVRTCCRNYNLLCECVVCISIHVWLNFCRPACCRPLSTITLTEHLWASRV